MGSSQYICNKNMKIFDCNNECQYCIAYYCEERNDVKYETYVTNQIEKGYEKNDRISHKINR